MPAAPAAGIDLVQPRFRPRIQQVATSDQRARKTGKSNLSRIEAVTPPNILSRSRE